MNILQIANKAIYPPDGGSLAILSLAKGYVENGHKVHLLNMITFKHDNKDHLIEDKYTQSLIIDGVYVNTRISPLKLVLNLLFSSKPYIAQRFISKKFKSRMNYLLQKKHFDIIQFEGLYSLQYINSIKDNFEGNIVYRPHNLEYLIWKRNYKTAKNLLRKWYFKLLCKRLKELELALINRYNYLIPISNNDAKLYNKLGNIKPIKVAPFGIDTNKISISNKLNTEKQNINYIGALDWIPNQEGLFWFIHNCFQEITRTFPTIQLNIAGRNAPSWFIQKLNHPNINYKGEVEDAYDFIQNPGPFIVPLFSGSGMRVKIIESMAFKKAIVATEIGAEGIHYENNKNILIANNSESFTQAVIKLLNNNTLQKEIGENAFKFVKDQYDFIKIASDILNFIK